MENIDNIDNIDVSKEVESLVKKADRAEKSDDALKFSQAACNAANAMIGLRGFRVRKSKE